MLGKLIKRLLGRGGETAQGKPAAAPAKPQAKSGGKTADTAKAGRSTAGKAKSAGDGKAVQGKGGQSKGSQSQAGRAKGGAAKAAPAKPNNATPSAGAELTKVKGIGATTAESLAGIGITSLSDLVAADPNDIAKRLDRPGLTPMRVRKWIDEAKRR